MNKFDLLNPIKYSLSLIKEGAKIGFKKQKAYKSRLFSWVLADFMQFGIMTVILLAIVKYNPLYTIQEVIIYYLLVLLLTRFCYDFSHEYVTKDILNGDFSKHLIRPGGYLLFQLGDSIGTRIFRVLTVIPALLVLVGYAYLGEITLFTSSLQITQILLAVFMAFAISFVLSNIFTMLTFYVKQIYGMKALYNNIIMIFSGEYIPIAFMPVGFASVILYLPFRFMLYFPIQITLGWIDSSKIWSTFAIGLAWLVTLILFLITLYSKSINKFEGEGI